MYTGTTRTPIFAGHNADAPMIKFLPFWVIRPRAFVLAAEATLTGVILAITALAAFRSNSVADTSIGIVLGVAGGQAVLHLAGIGRQIMDPDPIRFLRSVFGTLLMGLVLAGILFLAFPAFSQGYSRGLIAW